MRVSGLVVIKPAMPHIVSTYNAGRYCMSRDESMPRHNSTARTRVAICIVIFFLAFGGRLLSWHDTRLEVGKIQTVVSGDYKLVARTLKQDGIVHGIQKIFLTGVMLPFAITGLLILIFCKQ